MHLQQGSIPFLRQHANTEKISKLAVFIINWNEFTETFSCMQCRYCFIATLYFPKTNENVYYSILPILPGQLFSYFYVITHFSSPTQTRYNLSRRGHRLILREIQSEYLYKNFINRIHYTDVY